MSEHLPGPIRFEDTTEDRVTHSEDGVDLTADTLDAFPDPYGASGGTSAECALHHEATG